MPLFRNQLGTEKPKTPKQFKIYVCKVQEACALNKLWHSRFPKIDWSNVVRNRDYVCYRADFNEISYAVAIWSSPVAANRLAGGEFCLELRRMAISDDAPKNSASYMIAKMTKMIKLNMPHIKKLISYQDVDAHFGTIYKASNWRKAAENNGLSWTTKNRKRNKEQSLSTKIRWEFNLK